MSNILLVPVHLDALVLDYDQMVVETTTDFSRLPYCTGQYDINPDIANISEELVSTPFQNENLLLKAGIHLHWSLPDALTRARYRPDGTGRQDFPLVPNRWLVTRCNAADKVEKEWLVESDYLHPLFQSANTLANAADGVAMPFHQDKGQRFRFMGRSFEVRRQTRDDRAEYYPELTAVGYGEPTFAAFYPNCHSVFGFFDNEYSGKKDGRKYYLTGWYSNPDQDVLVTHVRDSLLLRANELTKLKDLALKLRGQNNALTKYLYGQFSADTKRQLNEYTGATEPTESLQSLLVKDLNRQLSAGSDFYRPERFDKITLTPETKELIDRAPQGSDAVHLNRRLVEEAFPEEIARRSPTLASVLKDSFKWVIAPASQEFPTRMICYARQILSETTPKLRNQKVTVAVGNTGTEALSACLAKRLPGPNAIVEDHLEAMHLSAALEHRQLDVGPKFDEARHEKGFTAVQGGTLWTVAVESTTNRAAAATRAEITLPHEMGSLLNVVNKRQAEYDRAWQQIESLRIQLFSDWYKYMLCAYPPGDTRDAYPDVDEVASYIADRVASLNSKIARTGKIVLNETGEEVVASVAPNSQSTAAAELATTINNLQAFIAAQPDKAAYKLKQTSGPRYWRPTEPSILLDGELAKPSARHGQDAPEEKLLQTQLLTGADRTIDPSDEKWRQKIREKIAELGSSPGADKNFAFEPRKEQPWNPFLLEWEVEVFPVANKSNIDPLTGRFHENFIIENYQLAENDVDLSLKKGMGKTTSAANLYSGRSILTPHAVEQLVSQTKDYLVKEVLPQYYREKNASVSGNHRDYLTNNLDNISRWYTSKHLRAGRPDENRDPNVTAFGALRDVGTPKSLSQSLSGFNEALLMHKQTPQLLIADPLGFLEYQPFAVSIEKTVNDSIYSAPAPQTDFNPIRSGIMKIHRLRLVDTFGQIKDLDVSKILMSESLDNGIDDPLVSLPPRLMQPARVNFRWLAADVEEEEMNDHPATTPICGWVLANNLDGSLMIYDNSGRALGSLVKKGAVSVNRAAKPKLCVWAPAPGGLGIRSEKDISNSHLQKMVKTIMDWGGDFLDDFITAIDSAVENIEPENFSHHQDLALLMGRPLALVRASVNLELKGLPATHQGWNEFRQDMKRDGRDDNGFTRVRFPIRIGEYKQFNDGTVGYWKEKGAGYEDNAFFAPQSDDDVKFKGAHLKTHKTDPDAMVFYQTVESEPQILSLLLDPRGVVHATTGIVPAKAISIPPDQYGAALESIEITFLSTPVLTDAGKIHLPLPEEAGYQWSWLQQDFHHTWSEVSTRGLLRKETFAAKFSSDGWDELIDFGWIEPLDQGKTRASVVAKDQRTIALLDSLKDKTDQIEDLLDRAHIGPGDPTAKFSGQQEIREGWLKLSRIKVAKK